MQKSGTPDSIDWHATLYTGTGTHKVVHQWPNGV